MAKPHNTKHLTPAQAIDRLEELYERATAALTTALDRYLETGELPTPETRAAFRYPLLRLHYSDASVRRRASNRRAFGKLQETGVYETTITHPGAFRSYLLEQLAPLVSDYRAQISVDISAQEIPYPYVLERAEEIARSTVDTSELARHFPTPHLSAFGDEIIDGLWHHKPGEPRPLALFDAARVDLSLRRIVHYTGSDWRHTQRWILLTNYHRYVDQFVRWGRAQVASGDSHCRFVLPGDVVIEPRTPPARPTPSLPDRPGTAIRCPLTT